MKQNEVIIIGGGLAGLTVALSLAPMPVLVVVPQQLGEGCASAWAQGGIAAAVGADDNAALHAEDTLVAGAGLCDPAVTQMTMEDGARVIETLVGYGVPFDRDERGQLRLTLEAAHRRRRIVHCADATGAAVMKALVAAVRATPSIEVMEDAVAVALCGEGADIYAPPPLAGGAGGGWATQALLSTSPPSISPASGGEPYTRLPISSQITGVVIERNGVRQTLTASRVVLATGGTGALWQQTSNPLGSWGRGLALAARAGAVLGNLEFMQFHPTCMDIGQDPMPLASEALRGEGCVLIDDKGERFIDELQPRDIVSRAIAQKYTEGRRVFLDARAALGSRFVTRFPTIHAVCLVAGIDPAVMPIPVRPAAHYHMGGVVTDANGRTNVDGLWACGEVACTGLHGANRLASNSLLEAASFGARVAEDIQGLTNAPSIPPASGGEHFSCFLNGSSSDNATIRSLMSRHVGVVRDGAGLRQAITALSPLAAQSDMALVALMIATAALRREESRGAQARSDFPETSLAWQHDQHMTLADIAPFIEPAHQRQANGA